MIVCSLVQIFLWPGSIIQKRRCAIMETPNKLVDSIRAFIRARVPRLDSKRTALVFSIVLLILFPDVAILILVKLLYITLSWLSLMFKHALQAAFGFSRHTAQMITAWIEAASLIAMNIWLFRKLNHRVQAWYLRRFDNLRR